MHMQYCLLCISHNDLLRNISYALDGNGRRHGGFAAWALGIVPILDDDNDEALEIELQSEVCWWRASQQEISNINAQVDLS
jgi:hypothetical protein